MKDMIDVAERARAYLAETARQAGEPTKGEYVRVPTAIAAIVQAILDGKK